MTIETLREAIKGPVLLPEDTDYQRELSGQNLAIQHTPEIVIGATSAEDVQAAVKYAAAKKMHIAIFDTGHGSQVPITGGMVITTKRLTGITIDKAAQTATIGGGVKAGNLANEAVKHGLAPVAGSATTVGVTGLVLGGGIGPMARAQGYSSDYARQFKLVTPDGQLTTANATENSELFWALRGGKIGLGVVIETTLKLLPLRSLYGGSLAFAEEDIERVLRGWVDWTKDAPADVTTSTAIMRFPSIDEMPPVMRGKTLLMLRFAYPGDAETGKRLAAPLVDLATPVFGELHEIAPNETSTIHNEPVEPTRNWTEGLMIKQIDDAFMDAYLNAFGAGKKSPFMMVELRQLGAATKRDVLEGSAASGRSGDFSLYFVGTNPSAFEKELPEAYDSFIEQISPYLAEETYINWWSGRDKSSFEKSWTPEVAKRLRAIRHEVDPEGLFAL